MRVYAALNAEGLKALVSGERVTAPTFRPETDDEADELAALEAAAEHGAAVVSADLDRPDDGLTLDDVASFHIDLDGSGHLAWFATQEIDAVLREVQGH